jgi:formyl-CoA transferase
MAIEGKMLEGVPTLAAIPIADYSTGMMMAWSICAALYHREKTGRGQLIETTLLGSALAVSNGTFQVVESVDAEWRERFFAELDRGKREGLDYEELKKILVKVRPLTALGNIQYRVFKTKDSYIVIGALSVALRRKLTAVIGVEDKRIGDPNWEPLTKESRDYARGLVEAAEAVFKEKTTDEWLALFDEAGVPAGPFKFTHELVDDEQVLANNLQIEVDHPLAGPVKMVGAPLQMSETPLKVQGPSPTLGQHNEDILSSLGYDDAQIAALRESGVIR